MIKTAPSPMEIGSMLQNKEVTKAKSTPMIPTPAPREVVDLGRFREAYNKAVSDGYKGKKSDFALSLEKDGFTVEGFDDYKKDMVKNELISQKRKSYFGMVADVVDTRYKNTKKQLERTKGIVEGYNITRDTPVGERIEKNLDVIKNLTATVGTPIGEGIGGVTDILFNTAGRAIRGVTPDVIERYVTKKGKEVWDAVKDKEFVKDATQYFTGKAEDWNEYVMQNPDEAQIMSNLLNISDVILLGAGKKAIQGGAKEVIEEGAEQTAKKMRLATAEEAKNIVTQKAQQISNFVKSGPTKVQDDLTNYLATKVGGLSQEAVETIKTNPLYTIAEKGELTRRSLGDEVVSVLEQRRQQLGELGQAYTKLRSKDVMVDIKPVRENVKKNILEKLNIKQLEGGTYDFRDSRFVNDRADQKVILDALDLLSEDVLDVDVALNRRLAISNMARFGKDGGEIASATAQDVVKKIRGEMNKQMHKDIKGLQTLDNTFSPEIEKINDLLKDYYNKDGSLKDSFYSTITNITNKGKELKYDRLNDMMPDIEDKVKALKAFEEVGSAVGMKVGLYERMLAMGSSISVGAGLGSSVGPLGTALGGLGGLYYGIKFTDIKNIVELLKKRGGSAIDVAKKVEATADLTNADKAILDKVMAEAGLQQAVAKDVATPKLPFFIDEADEAMPPPMATETAEQAVTTPTASLDDMLKTATDEELKAQGFTATMIKKIRKQTPAIQDVAQQSDELLQTPSVGSKVDEALPTAGKMETPKKELSELGGVKGVKPNNQLKFNQGDNYEPVRLVVNDKDAMVARYGALRNKDMQSLGGKAKLTPNEKMEMQDILRKLGIDDATATKRHQFLKDEAKKVRSSSEQVLHEISDDFREKQTKPQAPALGKTTDKTAKSLEPSDLTKEARKYKSVDEFVRSKTPKYMKEYVDKDGVITEHRYYDNSYPKTFVAKKDVGGGIKKGDIVALVKEKNEVNAIHSPYTKGGFKYTTERRINREDFVNIREEANRK